MFKITDRKGFHITFENGWTVSVQFGPGNYGGNYDFWSSETPNILPPSPTAEIAAWDASGKWHEFEEGDTVAGYRTPAQVLEFTNMIAGK